MKLSRIVSLCGCVISLLLYGGIPLAAVAQSPSAPTAAVSKSGTLHVSRCSTTSWGSVRVLKVWGTIDGMKVELMTTYVTGKTWVVGPGDYPLQMTHDEKTDRGIVREYDVDLTPGKRQTFSLSGLGE